VKLLSAALVVSLVLGLVGCSGPQVRTVGTGGGAPAYELRGTSLAAIQAEAARLCIKGYEVLRQSHQFAPVQGDDNAGSQWLQQAGDWLSGMPGNQAQATVQCRA
jgi:hypothetical protein